MPFPVPPFAVRLPRSLPLAAAVLAACPPAAIAEKDGAVSCGNLIYAGTKTDLTAIADGDHIAVPNDPTNENRALLLLQDAGLITLPEGTTLESTCTPLDIVENPHNLKIDEVNAELIPGLRSDVAYAVLNGNNAVLAGLVPYNDGL